nr:Flp family type IVb pilin [uncultured Cohaesibacter sp.]
MFQKFKAFLKDESGATSLEYGIIVGILSIVVIASMNSMLTVLKSLLSYLADVLNSVEP